MERNYVVPVFIFFGCEVGWWNGEVGVGWFVEEALELQADIVKM